MAKQALSVESRPARIKSGLPRVKRGIWNLKNRWSEVALWVFKPIKNKAEKSPYNSIFTYNCHIAELNRAFLGKSWPIHIKLRLSPYKTKSPMARKRPISRLVCGFSLTTTAQIIFRENLRTFKKNCAEHSLQRGLKLSFSFGFVRFPLFQPT